MSFPRADNHAALPFFFSEDTTSASKAESILELLFKIGLQDFIGCLTRKTQVVLILGRWMGRREEIPRSWCLIWMSRRLNGTYAVYLALMNNFTGNMLHLFICTYFAAFLVFKGVWTNGYRAARHSRK